MTNQKIAKILNTAIPSNVQDIRYLLIDSRQLTFAEQSLFFAFKGQANDGHDYIPTLLAKGLLHFVVTSDWHQENAHQFPQAIFYRVENVLNALQSIAKAHRQQFKLPVIGITGSNGKTIVKEWLSELLLPHLSLAKSPKSYNSQIGVPLSVWQLGAHHRLGIFEAGISRQKEMQSLAPIIDCSIGVFTNIGAAHSAGFENMAQKISEKLQLFQNCKTLIYCQDHSLLQAHILKKYKGQSLTWSTSNEQADIYIKKIKQDKKSTIFQSTYEGEVSSFTLPFTDGIAIENALHCWAVLLHLGLAEQCKAQLLALKPIAMRLQLLKGVNGCTIIDDTYSNDLTSLAQALPLLHQQAAQKHRMLIWTDFPKGREEETILYQSAARLLVDNDVHTLIGIGHKVARIQSDLPARMKCLFFKSKEEFYNHFNKNDFRSSAILVKGARVFEMESIVKWLSLQSHTARLEINLQALRNNFFVYKNKLQPHVKIMAMVKASAYGSGSYEVARLLEHFHADYLAVAYTDEGVALREKGIRLPIMVLNVHPDSFEDLVRYDLEPEIYALEQLQDFIYHFKNKKTSPAIHLKIDTGMKRLGFEAHTVTALVEQIQANSFINVQSIFTHLAVSEDKREAAFTRSQIQAFETFCNQLEASLAIKPLRHIANTAAILNYPDAQLDMVRLGIGLYGVDSTHEIQSELQPIGALKATISQIKNLERGQSVGYGRAGKVTKSSRIATVNIGYADGFPRAAGNGNYHLKIRQQDAPTIGNICMDMCMLDVSDIPNVQVGDEVVVFETTEDLYRLAACMDTIVYEVLTQFSERIKRVYVED